MAIFGLNDELNHEIDWEIMQNGWISLYWKKEYLDSDLAWFKNENYSIIEFDCLSWENMKIIKNQIYKKLDFPEDDLIYDDFSFDAINDWLGDLEFNNSGKIITFRHFDKVDKEFAFKLLDIFCRNARRHMLFGNRLIILIQVDDSKYSIDPVGAAPVLWNRKEWLNSSREGE